MKAMVKNISGLMMATAVWSFSTTIQAMEKRAVLDADVGTQGYYDIKVGLGGWDAGSLDQIYVSKLGFDSDFGFDKPYEQFRIGFEADSFSKGMDAGVFVYKTDYKPVLDRYGVGLKLGGGKVFAEKLKLSLSGELLPQIFSTDWDDDIYTEYNFSLKGDYRVTEQLSVNIGYRYFGMLTDKRLENLGGSLFVGGAFVF